MLVIDFIQIPWRLVHFELTAGLMALDLVMVSCWTLDAIMWMRTGFRLQGQLVTDQKEILIHYLKTWFIFDLTLLVLDWFVLVILSNIGGHMAYILIECFRALRLFRLAKLVKFIEKLLLRVNDPTGLTILRIFS